MGIVKVEEVVAVELDDGQIVCADCLEDEDTESVTQEKVLDQSDLDLEAWFFCDRCYKRLQ